MAHIFNLDAGLQAVLNRHGVPAIDARVVMRCLARVAISTNADGSHVFSTEYKSVEIDISERLSLENPIRIQVSKPSGPTGEGNAAKGANVQITIINTDGHWATTQDGALIDPDNIENATVDIYAVTGGEELLLYRGRVIGSPEERAGESVFTVRDAMSDFVDREVFHEHIGEEQEMYVDGVSGILIDTFELEAGVRYYDGYAYFDQYGRALAAASNSETDKIGILNIGFHGEDADARVAVKLGRYEIEFLDSVNFTLRYPGGQAFGNRIEDYISDTVVLLAADWDVVGDPTGAKIEFWAYYTVMGNPVTIIKRVIEHAFLGTWGQVPTQPESLPVDWDRLDELELIYASRRVYVSETTQDSKSPLTAKQLVEYVADHIGCYLVIDERGRLTLSTYRLRPGETAHEVTSDMLSDHSFTGGKRKLQVVKINYGQDARTRNYNKVLQINATELQEYSTAESYLPGQSVTKEGGYFSCIAFNPIGSFDAVKWVAMKLNEEEINMRYYKIGRSKRAVDSLSDSTINRMFRQHVELSAKMLPNFGLAVLPGDKFRFQLSEPPKRTFSGEVFSVSKIVGGEVVIQAVEIPAVIENNGYYCVGNYCEGYYA